MKTTNSNRERSFGLTVGAICCILWAIALWRGRGHPVWLIAVGSLLVLFGWIAPAALRLPSALWWKLSEVLGWINSRVILTVIFLVIFFPVGLIMRILGRDPLRLRRTAKTTCWEPYPARTRSVVHYEKMF